MKIHQLLPLISLLCLMMACSASSAQQGSATQQSSLPLLHFQKTPCLGICPAYNAMIYEDGSIAFVAYKSGLPQDTLLFTLTRQELLQLQQKLRVLHYKELQNNYISQWSDMPSTYTTFYKAGKKVKRVKHQEGGPEQLVQFQEWVHQLVWQRAEEKAR